MKVAALGVFLVGFAVSLAAQNSLVISGLRLTVGTPRADVERSLQPRFRAELMQNGEWAIWERATERAASAPVAGDPLLEMPEPPRHIPAPKPQPFALSSVNAAAIRAVEEENRHNMEVYAARMRLYESQVNAKALRQAAPVIRRLPVGYVRFSDDGKLCQVVKEWNANGERPTDSIAALAAALSVQKGREVALDSQKNFFCFLFPDTGKAVCARADDDGPASVTESTSPCSRAQPR